jgi:acyl-CoA synthetase (AMP-forming)/AMP-acid ligase II
VAVGPSSSFGRAAAAPEAELARCDLSSLRRVVARHEPGDVEALQALTGRLSRLGLDPGALVPCWGLSEPPVTAAAAVAGEGLTVARVDAARLAGAGVVAPGARPIASVGRPLPGVDVDVRDESGRALPEGRLGQLWLRAPAHLEGTEAIGPHGWLDTGDLGFVLGGRLYVHGRRDELVVVQGARHAPEEFERPLSDLAGLGAVVAVTLPPPRTHDGALLVLAERAEGGHVERLDVAVRRRLLDRAGVVPHTVALLPPGSLPRTGSGRLRRGEALRRWLAGTLAPPRGVNPVRLAVDAARSQLAWARLRLGG